ncbi:MAG: sortase [Patescibacteria group bacterium]
MNKKLLKICAVVWGVSGLVILVSVLYPIASYEVKARERYPSLISPIVNNEEAEEVPENVDYTKASNWFPTATNTKDIVSKVSYYTISIPALGIENATVKIGGEDLSESLIQYPGTANPGKVGNSVIFGHSILPIFYDPENYLAIFSTLDKLREGDNFYVNYDGISYKYTVEEMFEVKPTDIWILEQNVGSSNLSLVTCTPPGDPRKPKRLVVRSRLVPSTRPTNLPKQADANIVN